MRKVMMVKRLYNETPSSKTMKILIRIAGVINLLFAAFHVWLGRVICQFTDMPAEHLALMKMLNTGGTIFILFLGVSLTFLAKEIATTALGRLILLLGAATYLVRAAEELIVAPSANITIMAACTIIGLLHLLLFMALRCPCWRDKTVKLAD